MRPEMLAKVFSAFPLKELHQTMYLAHFNLKEKPFQITVDPKFLWLGEKHKEALSTLRYGILENKGFVMLTGEVGTGKTVLINRLVTMVDINTSIATIPDPDLESLDFFKLLADGFKINKAFLSKGGFLLHLRDFLHESYANQKQVVLIIDEAQRLNHKLLEEIRLLSNIEHYDRKLINIFFVGQNEFNEMLTEPRNRAIAQRISVKYNIMPLDKEETGEFIQHRLKVGGAREKIFNSGAIEEVFNFSKGIPRLINVVCDHALLTGYATGKKIIDKGIVKECARELYIPMKKVNDEKNLQDRVEGLKQQIIDELRNKNNGHSPQQANGKAVLTAGGVAPGGAAGSNPAKATDLDEKKDEKNSQPSSAMPNLSPDEPFKKKRSLVSVVLALCIIAFLLGTIGYLFLNLRSKDEPRWAMEDLTPDKYKTTLQKEGESLQAKLQKGADLEEEDTGSSKPSEKDEPPSKLATAPVLPDANPQQSETPSANQPPAGPLAVPPIVRFEAGQKKTIHFDLNSNEIDPADLEILDQIAMFLKFDPKQGIRILGYTDSSGSSSYNASVSQFRANTVKSYLIGKGAPIVSIKTMALGDEKPIGDNATSQGRRLNRRVEIEFIGQNP
jgi:general secretion pathway protein A